MTTIYVPSLHRPGNVPTMEKLAGEAELVWLVPPEEEQAYREAGATRVEVGHPHKYQKVNAVLDARPDVWNVFSDDDCSRVIRLEPDGTFSEITLGEAADEYVEVGKRRRDSLVIVTQITNRTFLRRSISDWGTNNGWFFAVAPHTTPRWDTTLRSCGDADFAAQHFVNYGRISRVNWIMPTYRLADKASHFAAEYKDHSATFKIIIDRYPHLFEWHGLDYHGKEMLGFRQPFR